MAISLLVADDQEVMRLGLQSFLARTKIEVVGEAASGRETLRLMKKHKPNVILLDVGLNSNRGFDVLQQIKEKRPSQAVLLWSSIDNPTYISRANALGACGYLLRGTGRSELIAAVKAAASGKKAWRDDHFEEIVKGRERPRELVEVITPREFDVLRHLAYGLPNKEIGFALGISYETVKEHMQHLLRKIDARDRTEAAVWAVRQKIV